MDKYDVAASKLIANLNWMPEREERARVVASLREAAAEAFRECGDISDTFGAPVMRGDAERGFYVACENLRDVFRASAAALRPAPGERGEAK